MRKLLKFIAASVVLVGVLLLAFAGWTIWRQGMTDGEWRSYATASVRFDAHGIPTIEAADWGTVVTAQGYVVASQRLWQMDLIRRKAGGRLAEWFGDAALAHDSEIVVEDRIGASQRAAKALPSDERFACESYARGVNDFIRDHDGRWGLEYVMLRVTPEPWTCADTLLVVLEMTDFLSSTAEDDAQQWAWRRNLGPAWQAFLFSTDHPWNKPFFGTKPVPGPPFPPPGEHLRKRPVEAREARAAYVDKDAIGSNNWAWRGPTGAFVANDPHMGYGVPQIWFAQRLRVAKDEWAVGVSLPGVPGIVLGMSPWIAWAFTNTGEDVDDFLEEVVSEDGAYYRVRQDEGVEVWQPVVKKTFDIIVKGAAKPHQVVGQFTHRGPLAKRRYLGDAYYSRQWLPLKDGMLRIPSLAIMHARDLDAFDRALNGMAAPSQNVVFMDRKGGMAYRMSGTGVVRRVAGTVPQPAALGEWAGFEPSTQRHRMFYRDEGTKPRHIATANQRLWIDPFGGTWFSDDRWARIDHVLSSRDDFKRQDMEALQLDTESRFRKLLLGWLADRAGAVDGPAAALVATWRGWDGTSRGDARVFTHSTRAEALMMKLMLGRVQATFAKAPDRDVPYLSHIRRAWLTVVLEAPGEAGVAPFGLDSGDLARFVVAKITEGDKTLTLHPEANHWRSQHPFATRVPILGALFRVAETPQWGASDLVLAEQPTFGPSMRLVWDLSDPAQSTWAFPVGQSGNPASGHFRDFHGTWSTGERFRVFDDGAAWDFPKP